MFNNAVFVVNSAETAGASDCGELDALAVQWIDSVDSELGQRVSASTLAQFEYLTNLTDYNQQQVPMGDIFVNGCKLFIRTLP